MLPIAREGRYGLVMAAALAAVMHWYLGIGYALPLWLLFVLLLFLFRDLPRGDVPAMPLAFLSPVDGRITSVALKQDPYLQRQALCVRVHQHLAGEFNMHSPLQGKLAERWLPARGESVQYTIADPDHYVLWMQSDYGEDVVIAVEISSPLHYMHCDVQTGERVGQGQRCGLMGFGRPVDIYLPERSRASVAVGDRVRAGNDILATLKRG